MFPSQGCQNTLRIAVLPNSSEQPPPPPKAFGTGFLLKKALHPERSDIRLVQTNEHVLNAAGKAPGAIVVIDASGIFALVSAVVFDTTLDLAVLLTKHPYDEREGLDIVDTDHIEVGSQVHTWGFPSPYDRLVPLLAVGHISGHTERDVFLNMAINAGNSGGAVLDENGKVVAVVKEKYISGYAELAVDLSGLQAVTGAAQLSVGDHSVDLGAVIHRAITFTHEASQLVMGIAIRAEVVRGFLVAHIPALYAVSPQQQ